YEAVMICAGDKYVAIAQAVPAAKHIGAGSSTAKLVLFVRSLWWSQRLGLGGVRGSRNRWVTPHQLRPQASPLLRKVSTHPDPCRRPGNLPGWKFAPHL